MIGAIRRAFRTPDLRKKLLFTLGILVIFRLGSFIPSPGIDYTKVQECVASPQLNEGGFAMINLFSGGALLQLSIFALGIMPYITASIIVQLLRVVIPRFEALHKEGASGQAKLTQYTRYLTIGLAILNSTTLVATVRSGALFGDVQNCQDLIANDTWWGIAVLVLTLTAGTGLIMWLGEQITEHGVGNGMSLLIFTSVASAFPSSLGAIFREQGVDIFIIVMAVGLVLIALVVFVEQSQRRIPVQYAKRMVGRRMFGGTSTYIPIKVNMAGVIPVIFASSVLYLPNLISQFFDPESKAVEWINTYFTRGDHPLYITVYALLTIFFAYFYVAITFNPEEVADNMKKYGGFIPGIRAGRPTAEYLSYVLSRINFPGSLYLAFVALIPLIALVLINANQNFPFGGTSLLIVVGVGLETVKQIDAQMQQRHYEGLLR
ncbi:protein translocase subunit secY/sec61 alpha [Brevibacterium iodinum ATCC 49514]|uniref:Protein translocase subunit SecY n=1 Tax=Brevibacterium iodinum ATCC 49514 TaxID=1255616 RepID=A0A2H1K3K4_9MICO|nr:preprotein translocase subunit SecY [Brevibacterium iodinum]SMX94148.1 protein translocase subunit secY/sec61 alpha [Brevibacterium iodinum ATCC 49514]SUW11644.1 preprotein translocase subunit SecY [Brevibacterium iodinum]